MSVKAELKIYNTLNRRKEDFEPGDANNVRLYVCGPTVYDFAHIGNARPVIAFDVLFRLLRHLYGESHVTYARNITDVDDKINARALHEFGVEIKNGTLSLNEAIGKITTSTTAQFHADVEALGCLQPTIEPRATDHIGGMIEMINELIAKGHAYMAQGAEGKEILFDVASMPDYGQLSKRKLEDQQAGARIAVEAHKKNAADFVLWKASKADEPGWDGLFDDNFNDNDQSLTIHGRPGWHIECSVMSKAHLGEVFDIHGGGLDLIFPHHENEIAQSRCAHDSDVMANYWMHNGFLQVEGRKMSKSEGNFITINQLLDSPDFGGRNWPGEVLRLAMLMTHYREPIDFSVRKLEEAENVLVKLRRRANEGEDEGKPDDVVQALCDDLNTPEAISALNHLSGAPLGAALEFLGISPKVINATINEAQIGEIIEKRLAFIENKDWAEADRIRDELLEQGIQLKDGKDAQTGKRTTSWEIKQ